MEVKSPKKRPSKEEVGEEARSAKKSGELAGVEEFEESSATATDKVAEQILLKEEEVAQEARAGKEIKSGERLGPVEGGGSMDDVLPEEEAEGRATRIFMATKLESVGQEARAGKEIKSGERLGPLEGGSMDDVLPEEEAEGRTTRIFMATKLESVQLLQPLLNLPIPVPLPVRLPSPVRVPSALPGPRPYHPLPPPVLIGPTEQGGRSGGGGNEEREDKGSNDDEEEDDASEDGSGGGDGWSVDSKSGVGKEEDKGSSGNDDDEDGSGQEKDEHDTLKEKPEDWEEPLLREQMLAEEALQKKKAEEKARNEKMDIERERDLAQYKRREERKKQGNEDGQQSGKLKRCLDNMLETSAGVLSVLSDMMDGGIPTDETNSPKKKTCKEPTELKTGEPKDSIGEAKGEGLQKLSTRDSKQDASREKDLEMLLQREAQGASKEEAHGAPDAKMVEEVEKTQGGESGRAGKGTTED